MSLNPGAHSQNCRWSFDIISSKAPRHRKYIIGFIYKMGIIAKIWM